METDVMKNHRMEGSPNRLWCRRNIKVFSSNTGPMTSVNARFQRKWEINHRVRGEGILIQGECIQHPLTSFPCHHKSQNPAVTKYNSQDKYIHPPNRLTFVALVISPACQPAVVLGGNSGWPELEAAAGAMFVFPVMGY